MANASYLSEAHHLGGPKELLELAESYEKIILEVRESNTSAQSLYKKIRR